MSSRAKNTVPTLSIFDSVEPSRDGNSTGYRMPSQHTTTTPAPVLRKKHEEYNEEAAKKDGWVWLDGMFYRDPEPLKKIGKCGPNGECTYFYYTGEEDIAYYIQKLNKIADRKAAFGLDYETSAKKIAPVDPKTGKFDLNRLSFSTEKTTKDLGSDPHTSIIFLCAISHKPGESHVIDIREVLDSPQAEDFKRALVRACNEGKMIAHNAVFELVFTRALTGEFVKCAFDTMVSSRVCYAGLLDPNIPWTDVDKPPTLLVDADSVMQRELGVDLIKKWQAFFLRIHPKSGMTNDLIAYVACDTSYLIELARCLITKLEERQLYKIWNGIERPFIPLIARTRFKGIKVDLAKIFEYKAEAEAELAILLPRWKEHNKELDYNSNKDLLAFYQERYPRFQFINQKGKESVDDEVLETLYEVTNDESVKILRELREVSKVLSTYLVPWIYDVRNPLTGRIHPEILQNDTATSRMSCKNPNLQNLPSKSKWHKIRAAFVCMDSDEDNGHEHMLVDRDLSQFEVRALADMAEEEGMMEFFDRSGKIEVQIRAHWAKHPEYGIRHEGSLAERAKEDKELETLMKEKKKNDFHTLNAIALFKDDFINGSDDDKALFRKKAKSLSFGLPYGISAKKIAADFNIEVEAAQKLLDTYYETWRYIAKFLEKCKSRARYDLYSITPTGRKRFYTRPKLFDDKTKSRIYGSYERQGQNMPVQGVNGDVLKVASILMAPYLFKYDAEFVIWVHDEILIDCRTQDVQHIADHMEKCMIKAAEICNITRCPIETSLECGKCWNH